MKVLKPGKDLSESPALRGTCPKCECEVEAEAFEATHLAGIGDAGFSPHIRCPEPNCGQWIHLAEEK